MAWIRCIGNKGGSLKLNTASGAIASFETNLPEPLQSVIVDVTATGGNGTPSTPVPINGYTEANIVNTQNESIVDLFSIDSDFRGTVAFNQAVSGFASNRSTINVSGNAVTATSDGETYYFGVAIRTANDVIFKPLANHKYFTAYKIKDVSVTNLRAIKISNGFAANSLIGKANGYSGEGEYSGFFIGRGDTAIYLNASILNDETSLTTDIFTIENVNIIDLTQMFGSTIADYIYGLEQATAGEGVAFFRNIYPDSYYPYDIGTTELVGKETPEATIAFGQTVYGGVLDVTRGKLHVTWGDVDLGDLEWIKSGNNYIATLPIPIKRTAGAYETANMLCECLFVTNQSSFLQINNSIAYYYTGSDVTMSKVICYSTGHASADDFKTAVDGYKLAYELATPIEITLDEAEQFEALLGVNNVWHDGNGDTEVKYLTLE